MTQQTPDIKPTCPSNCDDGWTYDPEWREHSQCPDPFHRKLRAGAVTNSPTGKESDAAEDFTTSYSQEASRLDEPQPPAPDIKTCPECQGDGTNWHTGKDAGKCPTCHGSGEVASEPEENNPDANVPLEAESNITDRELLHKFLGGQSGYFTDKIGRENLIEVLQTVNRRRG